MNIGATVGRFQVAELSAGHRFLIDTLISNHDRAVVFLGISEFQGTKYDPLNFDVRARMFQAEFPGIIVLPIKDCPSDEVWSKTLDDKLTEIFPVVKTVTFYGGRDSFLPHYKGQHRLSELSSKEEYCSGTAHRSEIGRNPRYTADFRSGVIYATENAWPQVRSTVDIAVV